MSKGITDEQCDDIWSRALIGVPPIDIVKKETFHRIIREAYNQGKLDERAKGPGEEEIRHDD